MWLNSMPQQEMPMVNSNQYDFGNSSSVREQFDRAVANLSGVMQKISGSAAGGATERLAIRLRA